MDKRTAYFKIKSLHDELEAGEMTVDELSNLIMMKLGGNVHKTLWLMTNTGLIKDIGNSRIRIIK